MGFSYPPWTPLLTAAKVTGAKGMTGRELAIYQAADAFELFTGLKPPVAAIGDAFDAVMASRYGAVQRIPFLAGTPPISPGGKWENLQAKTRIYGRPGKAAAGGP